MFFGMPNLLRFLGIPPNTVNRYFFTKYIEVHKDDVDAGIFVDELILNKVYREGVLTNVRSAAIQKLYSRARKIRFLNALILIFVVFVLTSAAFFIMFAGKIASQDASSLNSMQNLRILIDSQEKLLNEAEISQASTEFQIVRLQTIVDQKNYDAKEIQQANSNLAAEKIKKENLVKRISRITDGITKTTSLIDKIETSLVSDKSDTANPLSAKSLLIAAGITRFGVLVIVIYLVQILIGLYRYNARLMTFYLGQADALLLLDEPSENIGKLAEKLTPHFDFGKTDATLLEKVLEKMEAIVKFMNTKGADQKE